MIEKVIAAFWCLGWKFPPGIEKTEGFHPPKIRFYHPFENYYFPPRMCGIWRREEKGLSMDVNLVFLSVRFRPEKDRCSD